jgi:hypothetical protein
MLNKMRLLWRRKGGLAGRGKRAFCATGFEKRASQPALWSFLHCASTSLV